MKPYIQIVSKEGKITYMHSEGDGCDVTISGEKPNEFQVHVADRKNSEGKEFVFEPENVGRIIAHTIAFDTIAFVLAMFKGSELYELIECQELFYGVEGLNQRAIEDFNDNPWTDNEFFFRLDEEPDGKWTLCFVFHDQEVTSLRTAWEDFSPQ